MDFSIDQAVTREEALKLLFQYWPLEVKTELIPLQQALGRITAQKVYSRNSLPVCRCSQADGIAVRSADFSAGLPDTSGWLKGQEYVQADTGDDFDDAFDTVIQVEDIYYNQDGQLCFVQDFEFSQGSLIREKGGMIKEGELLVEAHVRLTPVHLAVLALGGIYQLEVVKKPKVVYIPTGNELISAGIKPERGQNVESNGLMVAAFLQEWGAEPICYPIIRDKPVELEQTLDLALAAADIVLINGGSSKGSEDFNAQLLQKRASFFRHGIKAVPGRPVAVAIIAGKPVINLPGPIIATFLAMDWCVFGLVHHYYSIAAPLRPKIKVKLEKPLQKNPEFEFYYRLLITKQDDGYTARPIGFDKSIPYSLLQAKALFIAPIGVAEYQAGEEVEAELL
ncbi:molybdopterin molybdotransferase MoeA [Desulfosporosinus sp. PR]|uniref:molybdopterin molybdotransferase MoeA n=1 Tax=Candidatus Desulfosporosinus nitrosoreducens TaxID=3401928 RepID=UPI0027F8D2E7|nr:molybdopterin molybdotransferase MoeA [Desulfosporosinus sp. PR]MDQ7094560.1 molybdopterin molybdotransferase MoeA [Desulfosporosinus sp. PR]